ncbi:glycosyltransferase family 4 protein [Chloroflexota bacterium]
MNILIITLSLSENNGLGRYSVNVANGLSKYADQIEVLVSKEDELSSSLGEKCKVHQILPLMHRLMSPLVLSRYAISIQKFIRKADIVHSFMDYPHAVLGALSTSIARKPLVITTHGTYAIEPLEHLVSGRLLRFAYNRAARVLCRSKFTESEILKRVPLKKTLVLSHGVDYERYQEPAKTAKGANKRVILSVGAIKARKGFDVSLRAFALVKKEISNIEYHIVGDVHSRAVYDNLIMMAEELGISRDVNFLGKVSEEELIRLYQTADVFMLTPKNIDNNFEGLGAVFLEASACGKPVVASDSGGVPDAVIDGVTGLLVPEGDVEITAQALKRVLTDKKLAEELGSRGRERAKELSWDNHTKEVLNIYEAVLAEARPSLTFYK